MKNNIDVFISYKREERPLADQVTKLLTQAGYVVGSDANLPRNVHFGDAIEEMIRAARLTIVLWTQASVQSPWVKMEAQLALSLDQNEHLSNKFIGVMVEAAELPFYLAPMQMLNLQDGGLDKSGLQRLLEEVERAIAPTHGVSSDAATLKTKAFEGELQSFVNAQTIDTKAAYNGYLEHYPEGQFTELARKRIASIDKVVPHIWRKAVSLGGLGVIGVFLGAFATMYSGFTTPSTHNASQSEKLTKEIEQKSGEIAFLKEGLKVTQAARDRALAAESTLSNSLNEIEQKLELANREVENAQNALKVSRAETTQQSSLVNKLRNDITRAQEALRSSEVSLKSAQDQLDKRDAELMKKDNVIKEAKANATKITTNSNALRAKLEQAESTVSTLKSTLKTLNNTLSKREAELATARSLNSTQRQRISTLEKNLTDERNIKETHDKLDISIDTGKLSSHLNNSTISKLAADTNAYPLSERASWLHYIECSNFSEVESAYKAVNDLLVYRSFIANKVFGQVPTRKLQLWQANYQEPIRSQATLGKLLSTIGTQGANSIASSIIKYLPSSEIKKHSLHIDLLYRAKGEYENFARRSPSRALEFGRNTNISSERPKFSYCTKGQVYNAYVTYDQIRFSGNSAPDLAEYLVAFWARRDGDGTYDMASDILYKFLQRRNEVCTSNRCTYAPPFAQSSAF